MNHALICSPWLQNIVWKIKESCLVSVNFLCIKKLGEGILAELVLALYWNVGPPPRKWVGGAATSSQIKNAYSLETCASRGINPLNPNVLFVVMFNTQKKILMFCRPIFCVDRKIRLLFPYTALPDFFYNRDRMCLLRCANQIFVCNSCLFHSG